MLFLLVGLYNNGMCLTIPPAWNTRDIHSMDAYKLNVDGGFMNSLYIGCTNLPYFFTKQNLSQI